MGIIYHAAYNVFVMSFFAQLPDWHSDDPVMNAGAPYFLGECGVPLAIMYAGITYYFIYLWKALYAQPGFVQNCPAQHALTPLITEANAKLSPHQKPHHEQDSTTALHITTPNDHNSVVPTAA